MITHNTPKRAFTLLEVIVAMAVLVVGILGSVAALNSAAIARTQNREMVIAMNAARQKYEEIANQASTEVAFNAIYTTYRFGEAANTFDITINQSGQNINNPLRIPENGNRQDTGGTAHVGWIDFPVTTLTNGHLLVDETITQNHAVAEIAQIARDLNMPQDLDGDGNAAATNLRNDDASEANDYLILPIKITIRWQGVFGVREYKLCSMLSKPAN